ncbi:uncharacterized protein LOC108629341 [Ceratina calcarata]|uniref:Uncharacterized protein LOC108629341 n=1 Tax=Ceratina calcarata TaxID=156304 RepID=A0AAJ7S982_9HYME|nr:uncharacterized protein LOC108629341 [Ceratina calcarata]XP_017887438.1 uncharacterized protein LOC108629341 [Ceratina calcarata]XP_026673040.1 uncharacterized protein LOC108629341 [Ceratina calcarata]XP_026673041.1 uncharacterized protein LOC108629341 [Ceratina calcarata]
MSYYHPNRENGILSSPDGQDPVDKLISAVKPCFLVGCGGGLAIQGFRYGNLETPAAIGRMVQVAFPLCGMGFFFATASFASARIRGKNDTINSLVGLYSTVPILRKFLPLSYVLPVLSAGTFLTVLLRELNEPEKPTTESAMSRELDACNLDWWTWSRVKPESAPYIKRDLTLSELIANPQGK